MKLVAMLRVKNEEKIIGKCLTKLSELVDEIVVVDNGSTDSTLQIIERFEKVTKVVHTKGYHQGRDHRLALQEVNKLKPDWVIWIDADEVFEEATNKVEFEKYMSNQTISKVDFRLFHLWKSKYSFRVDGNWAKYTSNPQRSMWRHSSKAFFADEIVHGGGIQGVEGKSVTSIYRIKHYGYVDPKKVEKKNKMYKKLIKTKYGHKTMDTNEVNLKTEKWRSFSNGTVNKIFLVMEKRRWDFIQKYYGYFG